MYVCMYVCMYIRMCVSTCAQVCMHIIISYLIQETTSRMMELSEAPTGYNSVHGVKSSDQDFKGDEYAIYSTSQQRIRYAGQCITCTVRIEIFNFHCIVSKYVGFSRLYFCE